MANKLKTRTTNQELFDTIRVCTKYSNSKSVALYKTIADELSRSASQRAEVNLSKIEKLSNSGDVIIVPGKVLATGILTKKVTIVAFSASETAIERIISAGAKFVTIMDYVSNKPATKVRIMK